MCVQKKNNLRIYELRNASRILQVCISYVRTKKVYHIKCSVKIKNKYFDLIIYPSVRRKKTLIEEVVKYNNKFIFIDGEDDLDIDISASSLGLYFKRELREKKIKIDPVTRK